MKRKYAISRLLNRPGFHSTAAIACKVEAEGSYWVNGEVQISDCSRVVTLDLSHGQNAKGSTAQYKNAVRKLDVLIDVLTKFRDEYIEIADPKNYKDKNET